jgi:3-dehydroquinate synthase
MTENSETPAEPPATVDVALGNRSYTIHIGHRVMEQAGTLVRPLLKRPFCVIVTDANLAELHLPSLQAALAGSGIKSAAAIVPPGETSKSYPRLADLCEELLAAGVERSDLVVALGGGVIGDLAGFAASCVRRGVDFVQVPTTLLAQVDSSVGGKTGINSRQGKNLIGAFHQPVLVIADTALLDTLPKREFRAGYAEVAKYGLLGDAAFFAWLEKNWQDVFAGAAAREHAIAVCCRGKAGIVTRDERETGERALLNLGHTFGHALEAGCGFSDRLLHGEAVALGTALAFAFSSQRGLISGEDVARVRAHLAAVGLPTHVKDVPGGVPGTDALMDLIAQDKKVKRGTLTFILVSGIGQAFIENNVGPAEVRAFLDAQLSR